MSYNRNTYDDQPVGGGRSNNYNSHEDQPVGSRGNNNNQYGSNNGGGRRDEYPAPPAQYGSNTRQPPSGNNNQYGSNNNGGNQQNQRQRRFQINVSDIVLWKDTKVTGTVVAGLFAILFVFGYMEYTVVTFLCRIAQIMFVGYSLMSYLGKVPPSGSEEMKLAIHDTVTSVQPFIVNTVDKLFRIFAWEDAFFTIKCIFGTIMLGILGNVFSDITLLLIATVVTFVGPLAYTHNKELIDPIARDVNTRASGMIGHFQTSSRDKRD